MGLVYSIIASFIEALVLAVNRLQGKKHAQRLAQLQELMRTAPSYIEWHAAALEHDRLDGCDKWRIERESEFFDYKLIEKRIQKLRESRLNGDIGTLILHVRAGLVRGLGGITDARLFSHCYVGTKRLVEEYVDEMCAALQALVDAPAHEFSPVSKARFFTDSQAAYGQSALLLSGGASLGLYHFGVVKRLYEFNTLPRVLSGSSIGALVVGVLGVYKDDELSRLFRPKAIKFTAFERLGPGSMQRKLTRLLTQGVLMDMAKLEEFCKDNVGNCTFLEAYHHSKREINIAVASRRSYEVPWLLNYLTAPNVLIWSAALASCAMPGIYGTVDIMAKDHKGNLVRWNPSKHIIPERSLEAELPMTRLAELFNVNHYIVSQVNPHVVPFLKLFQRGEWLGKVSAPLLSELHHIAVQLSRLGPRAFSFFQHVLTQKYVGHITIVPDLRLPELLTFFSNPSEEFCQHAIIMGERSTCKYLTQLKCNIKVELMIDRCVRLMQQQEETGPAKKEVVTPSRPRRPRTPTSM